MVAPIDQGGSALELLDKEAEVMCLVGVVKFFYASFRDDTAAVGLWGSKRNIYIVRDIDRCDIQHWLWYE